MASEKLLTSLLHKVVHHGNAAIKFASGTELEVGDGVGQRVKLAFKTTGAQWRLVRDPEMALGELYMDGSIVIEEGDVYDLHDVVLHNVLTSKQAAAVTKPRLASRVLFWGLKQGNTLKKALANASHHYNIKRELYDLFLGADMQYSCAYFPQSPMSIDQAQLAKKRHIAAKLLVEQGHTVLDIGCGWGGMAIYLAKVCGAKVRGVTLAKEQLSVAQERSRGLDQVEFLLQDYRKVTDKFQRIVSVGMLEHVGPKHFAEYFRKVAALLETDGVALIHTIARTDAPDTPNAWITKYIFPGGYIPAGSELFAAIQDSGLIVADVEVLRLHYAETLKIWRDEFMKRKDEAVKMYDAEFVRMWEFYLAISEASFRHGQNVVYQFQLVKRANTVPLTREYIAKQEAILVESERKAGVTS